MDELLQIQKWMDKRQITAFRLAKLSGVSIPVVYRFVKGERTITLPTLHKLQKAIEEFEALGDKQPFPKQGRPPKKVSA